MPVYWLDDNSVIFPPTNLAEPDGLLAAGGDLSVNRLISAYSQGIFPWYMKESPILWWFTNPRCVIFPQRLHVPRSLKKILASTRFNFTVNSAFNTVMRHCASSLRPEQDGTWILPEMIDAYSALHRMGWAHSVETWQEGKLVGGLYGVAMGKVFFGESMFFLEPDASKAAFVWLAQNLCELEFQLVDCQQETRHMIRFGAEMIDGDNFSQRLKGAMLQGIKLDTASSAFFSTHGSVS